MRIGYARVSTIESCGLPGCLVCGWLNMSHFFLWRRLFWRRVLCHAHVNGRACESPAVWKCVYGRGGSVLGEDFARDPLCAVHGSAGRCPTDRLARHVAIPESQQWQRVRLRVRIRLEDVCE
jgi:hypothetical protein